MDGGQYITVSVAARIYIGKHVQTVRRMCANGVFQSARQIGCGKRPRWQILRREVMQMVARKKSS